MQFLLWLPIQTGVQYGITWSVNPISSRVLCWIWS